MCFFWQRVFEDHRKVRFPDAPAEDPAVVVIRRFGCEHVVPSDCGEFGIDLHLPFLHHFAFSHQMGRREFGAAQAGLFVLLPEVHQKFDSEIINSCWCFERGAEDVRHFVSFSFPPFLLQLAFFK